MNKKDFYRAQGKIDAGGVLTTYEQSELMDFASKLVNNIEAYCDDGDEFGTEGWEHWIGWES